ncbi:MAG: hypothetical protein HC800_10345 [Phormidesmis sp. RL_2_1]|nr:hypothetical protein [Phormidesmis sp. RL_2_1]
MNHRFLLRLVTNLAVVLLTLFCCGVVLWVIDEFVQWDILPDAWSLIVRALLVAGGVTAFALLMMNVLLSLALLAESNASRARLPNYGISQQLKRRVRKSIVIGIAAIALTIGGLQVTNHFRSQAAAQASRVEFFQAQSDLNAATQQVVNLFTPPLLEAIGTNSLAEKGQLGNLSKLLSAIPLSFPHSPNATLILLASQPPFKYARVTSGSIRSGDNGALSLSPEFYATFPAEQEVQIIEQLFAGTLPEIKAPLKGQIINNTLPSAWGILTREGQVIAVVYLQSDLFSSYPPDAIPSFHHNGPDALFSN